MLVYLYKGETKTAIKKEIANASKLILSPLSFDNLMITLLVKIYNNITQITYDDIIKKIDFHCLSCPYCRHCCLIRYGTYSRHLKQNGIDIELNIVRVRCKSCNHTHALLPDGIVPYSQFGLSDHVNIIANLSNPINLEQIMTDNSFIDLSIIYHIKKNYVSFYKELLISNNIPLKLKTICEQCFDIINRQFMQIRPTINWLYRANNIAFVSLSLPIT